jgi:hypothetical protein
MNHSVTQSAAEPQIPGFWVVGSTVPWGDVLWRQPHGQCTEYCLLAKAVNLPSRPLVEGFEVHVGIVATPRVAQPIRFKQGDFGSSNFVLPRVLLCPVQCAQLDSNRTRTVTVCLAARASGRPMQPTPNAYPVTLGTPLLVLAALPAAAAQVRLSLWACKVC